MVRKFYKDIDGVIYEYEADGSQDSLIGDKVALTALEIEAHITPPITLDKAKALKLKELEAAFTVASNLPVKVGAKTYNGGKESALAIRDYIQLVTDSGGTVFTLWDLQNAIASYSLAEAKAIMLAIAIPVSQAEFNMNEKKNAVKVATTITAVNAVVW